MLSSMTTSAAFAFFFCFLFTIPNFHVCFCNGISSSSNHTHHNNITCFENEREALLKFKQDLIDPMKRLSSWDIGEDCCKWTGVVCDNFTGHVREILLGNPYEYSFENDPDYAAYQMYRLGGKLNPSLLDLKHLQYLDLSLNYFHGAHIPSFIGSIATLRYLNLSWAGFSGTIPPQLGNVTTMCYLDLGSNYGLLCGNLQWLSRLFLLQHLGMSRVNLSKALDWLEVTSNLPSLVELHLSDCELEYVSLSSTNKINFTSLDILDLSFNHHLGPSVPGWILNLNHLVYLDLSMCLFYGPIPSRLQNMTSLRVLDWSLNHFNSTIPNWLYSSSHLQSLSLCENDLLHGAVSIAIGNLTSLVSLDLSLNQLQGSIPTSLGKLCKLKTIDLSDNEFSGEVTNIFVGFSPCKSNELETFYSGGNHLLGHLPYELGQLTSLTEFNLNGNSFSGPIPASIGSLSSLIWLDLSSNKFSGPIPCKFNGTLPESLGRLGKLESLFINDNSLEGVVSDVHFANLTRLCYLEVGGNNLTLNARSIYHMLCDKGEEPNIGLYYLNMGHNRLSGKIPDCWKHWQSLVIIKLENNNLEGSIPSSIGLLPGLKSLHLRHNNLTGELPQTLRNCSLLLVMDLGENKLTGTVPPWMGNASLELIVLDLRSNNFLGNLPYELCRLSSLQILDVAHNNLFGPLPRCFTNFSVMAKIRNQSDVSYTTSPKYGIVWPAGIVQFLDNAILVTKGRYVEYGTTLRLVTSMDLSGNTLYGEIPEELTKLVGLWSLNLSDNHLTGRIPRNIGDMRQLESLDFSLNQLSGEIPSSMSSLTFLSHLNLSYNNLTGSIPSST
ncbi:receptor-like protein EIX1 [Rhododendron vialii]|uniref:receptor-like protein EIX1 n=1 Tax=Rhododendron vialii TaxID=182163 RepID=UPI00265ED961|nr:receptor-like protein EIX1 [Rhododendron vialii]